LPSGTVTFLFTDLEGSTRLLQQLGTERYTQALETVRRLLRAACAQHHGYEVDATGDGSFFAFAQAPDAVAAAAQAQRALAAHTWPAGARVLMRMGLHTGTVQVVGDQYIGLDVHRAARIGAAGHGGQALLSQTTRDLVENDLPGGAMLRDLGAHRLKDLQRPERLFELVLPDLPADFPPLQALDRHAHNLPIQLTPLLGREQEVAAVVALLRRQDVRLVTLTGPGGVGKTRLALQAAAELTDAFPDGVWLVSLSRLADSALVVPTIARTLGLQEVGSRPLAHLLREYLQTRRLLLLLDNCEQVAAAAPAIAELLQTSPQLSVLATSRVRLRLRGEKQALVRPLPLPDPAHLPPPQRCAQYPAVALFVQRAQDADAAFALTNATALAIAAICARLDGLPLAIELAAAKALVLPPGALLARLERQLPLLTGGARDLEARQQTMRATLTWSEELLSPEEQRLFRRLAVFVGGFTLAAAEAVCAAPAGAEPLGMEVVEGLERLLDQHLVQRQAVRPSGAEEERTEEESEARFRLLYVVREYALERLEASGEAEAIRRAHAVHSLALVEERALAAFGPPGVAWLERLEREHDNFRAALSWARERGETELGLRLAAALGPFWYVRGYHTEGGAWVEELLAQGGGMAEAADGSSASAASVAGMSAVARAKALVAASNFAWGKGDAERAQAAAEEALALARSHQAGWAPGVALEVLGVIAWDQGDLQRAMAYLEESVAQMQAVGVPWLAAAYLNEVGGIALEQGDLERATACHEESLAFARRTGADYPAGAALEGLANVARLRGDLAGAERLGREQLLAYQRLSAPIFIVGSLASLALTAAAASEGAQAERAARLLGAFVGLREQMGAPLSSRGRADIERDTAQARTTLGEEIWAAAFAAGQALSLEEAIAEALG
jgi:predicted ATPase/class 3 adenylate cyclase